MTRMSTNTLNTILSGPDWEDWEFSVKAVGNDFNLYSGDRLMFSHVSLTEVRRQIWEAFGIPVYNL